MADSETGFKTIFDDPRAALARKKPWSDRALSAFCDQIDVLMLTDSAKARRLASIAVRLAKRSKSRYARARAWCALGACLRTVDRLDHAEACYQLALLTGCQKLEPEVYRRWSYAALYRHQLQAARWLANRAVRGFARRGDTHRVGRSLLARGLAREDSGDRQGAYQDYRTALKLIPHWDHFYHAIALQTLTAWLACGHSTRTELEEALASIAEARRIISKHRGYQLLRARLRWAEVLVLLKLRRISPANARSSLERVVNILTKLRMPQDAAAAVADLAMVCARHCRSADAIEQNINRLCDALETPEALQSYFSELRRAAAVFEPRPKVSDAARALRTACSGHGILSPIGLDESADP